MTGTPHLVARLVETVADAAECLAWVDSLREPVAIDTETTGLDWMSKDFCRLVQFGNRDEGWAIPLREWYGVAEQCMRSVVDRGLPVIMHNCAFDLHALDNAKLPMPLWINVHDTMVMDHLLIPHQSHALKTMSVKKFGVWAGVGQKMLQQAMRENGWDWATVPTNLPVYYAYSVIDTCLTRRIYDDLWPEVERLFKPQYEREMSVREIMWRAEVRGLRVDPVYTQELFDSWQVEALNLGLHLQSKGIKNPASNQQVEAVLRGLGWDPEEFTETGQAVLNRSVKNALMERYPEIAPQLIRYHRITKWSAVYLRRFLEQRDATDHVHADIRTLQARTGRMSITGIPLQTLPSGEASIRRCILPDDGFKLWAVDYQSQEARLFAAYSRDPGMVGALNAGEDLYTYAARTIWSDPTIDKDHPIRKRAKIILLAFTYGAGVDKLAKASGLPHVEVDGVLRRLFELFPNVRNLTGDHAIGGHYKGSLAEKGAERLESEGLAYILTGGGRRFSVPDSNELYKMVNGLMQGTGADVLKMAAVRLDAAGLSDSIVVPVHDELVFQFEDSPAGAEQAAEAAKLMEDHSYRVPLTTELSGPLDTWGTKYE